MSEEMARYETGGSVVNFEDYAMNVESLVKQVALIQNVMERVMKDGEHYGVIPGTNKPTLLKPGAEKLCMVFRLEPSYDIIREFREDHFIAYTIKCTLTHIPTGQTIASGVGSCNSREAKYRWRSEPTDREVPSEYWDTRNPSLLGGSNCIPRKKKGKWIVYEQVENDNPWDLDNTIMKMACKRALVASTLNATAASDIFTQDADVEDMAAETPAEPPPPPPRRQAPQSTGEDVRAKLATELSEYCTLEDGVVNMDLYTATLKEVSQFGNPPKWITDIDKASEAWCGKALGALRKKVAETKEAEVA